MTSGSVLSGWWMSTPMVNTSSNQRSRKGISRPGLQTVFADGAWSRASWMAFWLMSTPYGAGVEQWFDPSEIPADVAADLERGGERMVFVEGPPEPAPMVVRAGVPIDVVVAEVAGPEFFEPVCFGRQVPVVHATSFGRECRGHPDTAWLPSASDA